MTNDQYIENECSKKGGVQRIVKLHTVSAITLISSALSVTVVGSSPFTIFIILTPLTFITEAF